MMLGSLNVNVCLIKIADPISSPSYFAHFLFTRMRYFVFFLPLYGTCLLLRYITGCYVALCSCVVRLSVRSSVSHVISAICGMH